MYVYVRFGNATSIVHNGTNKWGAKKKLRIVFERNSVENHTHYYITFMHVCCFLRNAPHEHIPSVL